MNEHTRFLVRHLAEDFTVSQEAHGEFRIILVVLVLRTLGEQDQQKGLPYYLRVLSRLGLLLQHSLDKQEPIRLNQGENKRILQVVLRLSTQDQSLRLQVVRDSGLNGGKIA